MIERPILFSAPMVRALLAGTKTQTRRVAKFEALEDGLNFAFTGLRPQAYQHGFWTLQSRDGATNLNDRTVLLRCPYGQPGDQLWVRENGWERPPLSQRELREGADTWPPYEYDAEPLMCWEDGELKKYGWKRRPSIHMPRWASRILLEVTEVRVQRLQTISSVDALEEGAPRLAGLNPQVWYRNLWDTINIAKPERSWAANPWVFAVSFKRAA